MLLAMAAAHENSRSCFTFLKEGLLLPARNPRLFAPVVALTVAFTSALALANALAFQPLAADFLADAQALQDADPASPEYAELLREVQEDVKKLMLVAGAYLLFTVIAGAAVRLVTVSAATATCTGERPTFWELLCMAKGRIRGPLITLAFVYVLIVLITALMALLVFLVHYSRVLLLLVALLIVLAALFVLYFDVVCSVAVVVSVAEHGRNGAAALSRAWRLMAGKKAQAVLYVASVSAMSMAIPPLYTLAMNCALRSIVCGPLLGFAYALLLGLLDVFATGAVTTYYFECKNSMEAAAYGYVILPSAEA